MPASVRASTSSAVPTVNRPPASSQRLVQVVLEQGVRLLVLVQDADLVTLPDHALRDRGADPAAADDQYEHRVPLYVAGGFNVPCSISALRQVKSSRSPSVPLQLARVSGR